MHRVDMLAVIELTRILQGKLGFVTVYGAAMHEQASGFVYRQQMVIAVNELQGVGA
jgi:hypothetical protein